MRTPNCNYCGKFIAWKDINSGNAKYEMIIPDSYYTQEEWETVCKKCLPKRVIR